SCPFSVQAEQLALGERPTGRRHRTINKDGCVARFDAACHRRGIGRSTPLISPETHDCQGRHDNQQDGTRASPDHLIGLIWKLNVNVSQKSTGRTLKTRARPETIDVRLTASAKATASLAEALRAKAEAGHYI